MELEGINMMERKNVHLERKLSPCLVMSDGDLRKGKTKYKFSSLPSSV